MSATVNCQGLCDCSCVVLKILRLDLPAPYTAYSVGNCAVSNCCSATNPNGEIKATLDDGGYYNLLRDAGGNWASDCSCRLIAGGGQSNAIVLYRNGDMRSTDTLQMTCRIWLAGENNQAIYVRLEPSASAGGDPNFFYAGYATINVPCSIRCYQRTGSAGLEPVKGYAYFPETYPITKMTCPRMDDPSMLAPFIFEFTLLNAPLQCSTVCAVSQRAVKGVNGGMPSIALSEGQNGRCPTVTVYDRSNFPAGWYKPGWQCQEVEAKIDCYGNTRPARHEHIVFKHVLLPEAEYDIPCELDCCDLFIRDNYIDHGACTRLEDEGAWWQPTIASGWRNDARTACLEATVTGKIVWKVEIGCNAYYRVVNAGVLPFIGTPPTPNPEFPHITFTFTTPCSTSCRVHQMPPLGEISEHPISGNMTVRAGERLPGVTEGNCLALLTERFRVVVEQEGGIEHPICGEKESYLKACAVNVSPYAPNVTYTIYGCPDCASCYEADEVTPKPGFVKTRYYTEYVYGPTPQAAADNALARAAVINSSVTNVVPYAHLLVPSGYTGWYPHLVGNQHGVYGGVVSHVAAAGCCAGAWTGPYTISGTGGRIGYSFMKWADRYHVDPCGWNIKYNSIVPNPDPNAPTDKQFRATLMMCCRCLFGDNLCNPATSRQSYNADHNFDIAFTDFWSEIARIESQPDADGNYCRDFTTPHAMIASWEAYEQSLLSMECWFFSKNSPSSISPWQYVLDPSLPYNSYYSAYGHTGNACEHTVTNHRLNHRNTRYRQVNEPTRGYQLACRRDANDSKWYWTGFVRSCRWCDEACSSANGCPPNRCAQVLSHQGWESPPGTTENCWSCTNAFATTARNILWWDSNTERYFRFLECPGSATPDANNQSGYFLGCGIDLCHERCNARVSDVKIIGKCYGLARYDCTVSNGIWSCWGIPSDFTTTFDIQGLLATYNKAVKMCMMRGIINYNPNYYSPCETVAQCCNRFNFSLNPADYQMVHYSWSGSCTCDGIKCVQWEGLRLVPKTAGFPCDKMPVTRIASFTRYAKYEGPSCAELSLTEGYFSVVVNTGDPVCSWNRFWSGFVICDPSQPGPPGAM